ncbi:hypothetical protein SOVF_207070 [Spinacia oleracea]|nr:hypothetical protein SOVF_207070 [Spinacia oleracea]
MVTVVEITKGNIQLCHPFFQTPLSNLSEYFNLSKFHSSVLTQSYHIASSNDQNIPSALSGIDKVLMSSTQSVPRINDCLLLVLHNGRLGGYPSFKAENDKPEWDHVSYRGVDDFDDVVSFKGVIYAVDWEGKLYQMATQKVSVQKTLVSGAVSNAGAYQGRRKRLVGSLSDQKLYLLVRDQKEMLKVYKLSKHGKIWIWVMVQSFEDKNQVLFLSSVYGFFVAGREFLDCQLSNCIVFSDNAFPIYSFRGWVSSGDVKEEEEILIFRLGVHGDHSTSRPISSYPNFPVKLWSPPSWVLQSNLSSSSPFQLHSDQRHSEDKKMQLHREQAAISPPPGFEALGTESSLDPTVQTNSVIAPRVLQPVVNKASTLKFHGVDVHPEHLPILQNVWMKHGDVVKESKIHSNDFIATTLASLAKLILILQSNSGKTLTDEQAHYMSSTLSDLQSISVKVDWLVPFVEKALALHKRKPLEAALAELEKAKAKVEEMNRKFLAEMAEIKQGFSTDKKQIVCKSICVQIDTDKCLSEGLF